jgi:hypothetical protein
LHGLLLSDPTYREKAHITHRYGAIYIAAEGGNGIKKRIAGLKKVAAEKGLPADIPFHLTPSRQTLEPATGIARSSSRN